MGTAILAARLIQVFEGCKLTSYWDATGKRWTIGFGHTKDVTKGMTITVKQAVEFMGQDFTPLFRMVEKQNYPPAKAAALVSFGYNCGIGALARFISGEIVVTEDGFFVKEKESLIPFGNSSGGIVLPGLINRRQLEAALILLG